MNEIIKEQERIISRIVHLEDILKKRSDRLQNMKLDLPRESIKRRIKILHKLHNCKLQVQTLEEENASALAKLQKEVRTFASFGKKVRNDVEIHRKSLLSLEKIQREIVEMELEVDDTLPFAGRGDEMLLFLESGIGERERPSQKFLEMKSLVKKFQSFVSKSAWKFYKSPIGPFYSVVSVKEQIWSALLEAILKPHLFTVLVDNVADQKCMEELIHTFFGPPPEDEFEGDSEFFYPRISVDVINYTLKFEEFVDRVRGVEGINGDCVNLMDSLEFAEENQDTWKIFLAEKVQAEKIVLFKTEHDAFLHMHNQARADPPNQVVKMAYSLDGFKILPFPRFKTVAVKLPVKSFYLKADITYDKSLLETQQELIMMDIWYYATRIEKDREAQFKAIEKHEAIEKVISERNDLIAKFQNKSNDLSKSLADELTVEREESKIKKLQDEILRLDEEFQQIEEALIAKTNMLDSILSLQSENMLHISMEPQIFEKQMEMGQTIINELLENMEMHMQSNNNNNNDESHPNLNLIPSSPFSSGINQSK